jgi:DNA polymerase-3 subunit beta
MKLSTSRDALFAQLQTVTRAASTRSAVQALSGVQVVAGRRIELRATDMEIGLRVPLEGEVEREGAVVLPGRLLVDVVRALPGDEVSLELRPAEQDVEIVVGLGDVPHPHAAPRGLPAAARAGGGDARARAGEGASSRRSPRSRARRRATRRARASPASSCRPRATSCGWSRPTPTGCRVKETTLEAAARGLLRGQRAGPGAAGARADRGRRGDGRADDLHHRANQVVFEAGGVVLSSRLIDGQFPNYRQLLPDTYEHELQLDGRRDRRRRAAHLAARAEERAAAAGVQRGRADGLGAHARRRRGERDAARPVPGRAARDRLQPGLPARRPRERRVRRRAAQADLAAAAGADRGGGRQRVPLPAHADPAERLARPWRTDSCSSRGSPSATSAPTRRRTSAGRRD